MVHFPPNHSFRVKLVCELPLYTKCIVSLYTKYEVSRLMVAAMPCIDAVGIPCDLGGKFRWVS